jgi:alpha-glucoside transport system permease protein
VSGASITAEPSAQGAPPPAGKTRDWRGYAVALGFLAPTLFFLGLWIVYPAVNTFKRSFYSRSGDEFIWFDNYEQIFASDVLFTAVKNNAIWVLVVPALVTAIGLVFAVLTERVSWSVAFKTAVFMPMAISAFAAGVTWRIMYQQDPDQGAINAAIAAVRDAVDPPGVLSEAAPSTEAIVGTPQGGLTLAEPVEPGSVVPLGLTRVSADEVPEDHRRGLAGLQTRWRHSRGGGERGGRPARCHSRAEDE